jgi:bis(5'-adenosyl)-triphosphatase
VVNLKPLLPGHVLVSPVRVLPRLADLSTAEINDLFNTVTRVQKTLTRLYKADGFNIAVQDGPAAGQSVPHVHCHVIPRSFGDPAAQAGDDMIHTWLEGDEGDVGQHQKDAEASGGRQKGQWADDEDRKPRSKDEMNAEAAWLREEMAKDESADGKL